MNTHVSFEIAKLLKDKEFDTQTLHFYTKPNSKMFGIDEHGRYYPMKNKAKSLWTTGNAAALKVENVYQAPTIAEVVMWLYEKHGVWVWVERYSTLFRPYAEEIGDERFVKWEGHKYSSPTEAYEKAIIYLLKQNI